MTDANSLTETPPKEVRPRKKTTATKKAPEPAQEKQSASKSTSKTFTPPVKNYATGGKKIADILVCSPRPRQLLFDGADKFTGSFKQTKVFASQGKEDILELQSCRCSIRGRHCDPPTSCPTYHARRSHTQTIRKAARYRRGSSVSACSQDPIPPSKSKPNSKR